MIFIVSYIVAAFLFARFFNTWASEQDSNNPDFASFLISFIIFPCVFVYWLTVFVCEKRYQESRLYRPLNLRLPKIKGRSIPAFIYSTKPKGK